MNAQPTTTARLEVPVPGGGIFFAVFGSFVAFFTWVALYLLFHSDGLTVWEIGGSIVWLAIVALWLIGPVLELGIRASIVSLVGIYSRRAFVETQFLPNGGSVFRYGFELLGKGFYFDPINVTRIGMVNWDPGQASCTSGRDCKDWSVAVWYAKAEGVDASAWNRLDLREKSIRIVTPGLPKEKADEIGRSVVALLKEAGVPLIPTVDAKDFYGEFVVQHATN